MLTFCPNANYAAVSLKLKMFEAMVITTTSGPVKQLTCESKLAAARF